MEVFSMPQGKVTMKFYNYHAVKTNGDPHISLETWDHACGGSGLNFNINGNTMMLEMRPFTGYDCEIMNKFSEAVSFPLPAVGNYTLCLKREEKIDSASIIISDSQYVMHSLSKDIIFETDTIRRILPGMVWAPLYWRDQDDSVLVSEFDAAMKAIGCIAINPRPGNYDYFQINPDGSITQSWRLEPYVIKMYQFTGDKLKLIAIHDDFVKKYHNKIVITINGWDKVIVL